MKELISVIVPVFNTERYLERCIDSILGQTYRDLEIILVDDGSTDRSGEICEVYAKRDSRIRVLHQQNSGQASARNKAIELAGGTYLGFVDSDDYIEKDMFEYLYNGCKRNSTDIAVCGYSRVSETGELLRRLLPSEQEEVISNQEAVYEIFKDIKLYSFLWDKLFRRELFENIKLPEGKIFEDVASVFQIVYKANAITLCPQAEYCYVVRNSSTIAVINHQKFEHQLEAYQQQHIFAEQFCKQGLIWINYHMAEVKRRGLDFQHRNKLKEISSLKRSLRMEYRDLLKFIWRTDQIPIGRKLAALTICISPDVYSLIRLIKE